MPHLCGNTLTSNDKTLFCHHGLLSHLKHPYMILIGLHHQWHLKLSYKFVNLVEIQQWPALSVPVHAEVSLERKLNPRLCVVKRPVRCTAKLLLYTHLDCTV